VRSRPTPIRLVAVLALAGLGAACERSAPPAARAAAPENAPAAGRREPPAQAIAFTSTRDGNGEIYVMPAAGGEPVRLTHVPAADSQPAWSPDGRRIAFVAFLHGADPQRIGLGDAEIFVVGVHAGRPMAVSRNASWDGDPAWSPDGRWIVFTRRTGHAEIYVMRPDGSDQRRLSGVAGLANDCCPAWRPR
jgi:TolB protein